MVTPVKYMHRGKEIELFSPQDMVPDPPTRVGRNGRTYTGKIGWRWIPMLNGEQVGDPVGYKTKKEANNGHLYQHPYRRQDDPDRRWP